MLLVVSLLPAAAMASQTNMIIPAGSQYYIVSVESSTLDTAGRIQYISNYPANTLSEYIYMDIFDMRSDAEVTIQAAEDLPFEAPEGRYFRGWSLTPDGSVAYKAGDSIPTQEEGIALYACWSSGFEAEPTDSMESQALHIDDSNIPLAAPASAQTHTVHFLDMDGRLIFAMEVQHGSAVQDPVSTPTADGYSFDFWYDATTADATPYDFSAPLLDDVKLCAMMSPDAAVKLASAASMPAAALPDNGLNIRIIDDSADEVSKDPTIDIVYTYENGADSANPGSKVTLTAVLANFPEGTQPTFQWQREEDGTFTDIAGATDQTYTFTADATTLDYNWRVNVNY